MLCCEKFAYTLGMLGFKCLQGDKNADLITFSRGSSKVLEYPPAPVLGVFGRCGMGGPDSLRGWERCPTYLKTSWVVTKDWHSEVWADGPQPGRASLLNPFIGRSQDGGGIGRGDHFLFYKFIERKTERWTKFTKQLLIASSGHQAPRKAAHCLRREVGQGYWRSKGETRERGTETRPGKGVLLEQVSNHQETLALAGPGEVFKSQRAT